MAGMVFVADDLAAWLVGLLADAARRRLTTLVLGSNQERALRQAASAAVQLTAQELYPEDDDRAAQLAIVVSQVFSEPVPGVLVAGQATLLEALEGGIAEQLAVLGDAALTDAGESSGELLDVSAAVLAAKLASYLVREIVVRGARGGPLAPLADHLNHDVTHLKGQRLEGMFAELADEIRGALARSGGPPVVSAAYSAQPNWPMTSQWSGTAWTGCVMTTAAASMRRRSRPRSGCRAVGWMPSQLGYSGC